VSLGFAQVAEVVKTFDRTQLARAKHPPDTQDGTSELLTSSATPNFVCAEVLESQSGLGKGGNWANPIAGETKTRLEGFS
jgi:hypothetical protein